MSKKRKRGSIPIKIFGELFESVCTVGIVVASIFCICCIRIVKVSGDSMANTYKNGQYVIAVKSKEFARGDIVVFDYNGVAYIKRIIAVEGDTVIVDYDKHTVSVNGKTVDEPYLKELIVALPELEGNEVVYPYTVSEGCYFVMGDNRNSSVDSRYFGEITNYSMIGKVWEK